MNIWFDLIIPLVVLAALLAGFAYVLNGIQDRI